MTVTLHFDYTRTTWFTSNYITNSRYGLFIKLVYQIRKLKSIKELVKNWKYS